MKHYTSTLLLAALTATAMQLSSCYRDSGELLYDGNNGSGQTLFGGDKYEDYGENDFIEASKTPVSTFAVDADGASYSNTCWYVDHGFLPPVQAVRVEEFLNYFPFDYPEPTGDQSVAICSEVSTCPWSVEHHLVRVGLRGKSISDEAMPGSNYVFLIDVSGSMDSPLKLGVLKEGFATMVDNLRNTDRVAIVVYSGRVQTLLESTPASEKMKIKEVIASLEASGSTAGGAAIETAYSIAADNYIKGGNNRIVLGTDGDFNVGVSSTEELVEMVKAKRDEGIYLTVLGVGHGNLNEAMMERLANRGNGNYEFIGSADEINKVFTHDRGKFFTVASDAKIQVTFNPDCVERYRLIGYENRTLNDEAFDDDTKDGGEIGSGQTITALYEVVLKETSGKLADLDLRYKPAGSDRSQLLSHAVAASNTSYTQASAESRFAYAVAAYGMWLKESKHMGSIDKQMILSLTEGTTTFDPHHYRQEFAARVEATKK